MIRFLAGLCIFGLAAASLSAGGDDAKDPKNWTPVRIRGGQEAPEFEDIAQWLNSPTLTMKALKGKVVVIHFMAFG